MTPKRRFLAALDGKVPDRLPVTTHHLMPSFLETFEEGITPWNFFHKYGLDPIVWITPVRPDLSRGERFDPGHTAGDAMEPRRVVSDTWRIVDEPLPHPRFHTRRLTFRTPRQDLSMVLQSDRHTTWVSEHLIKNKTDIDSIAAYMTIPLCDTGALNREAARVGEQGLIRGHVPGFDGYGQPGCWQDLACLFGIENLIMAVHDDPAWVHTALGVLQSRKQAFLESAAGAGWDLLELGGGDASTTVISPRIFNDFVAPYDARLIETASRSGLRVVYHTCGGMMPILEDIAAMNPSAMETFTPPSLGGDTDLAAAKRRIGGRVCMIGGFDQFTWFRNCRPEETRAAVKNCFQAAGEGGGFILAPSDHFFEADTALLRAFAEAARECVY